MLQLVRLPEEDTNVAVSRSRECFYYGLHQVEVPHVNLINYIPYKNFYVCYSLNRDLQSDYKTAARSLWKAHQFTMQC